MLEVLRSVQMSLSCDIKLVRLKTKFFTKKNIFLMIEDQTSRRDDLTNKKTPLLFQMRVWELFNMKI